MKKKVLITLNIVSILIPYIGTVFFHRTASILILLPVYFFSLLTLIVTSIWYIRIEKSKYIKRLIGFGAIVAIILYFVSYGLLLSASDYIFFKLREKRLNEFVFQIRDYGKITEMSDAERYWKTVNFYSIEPDIAKVDTITEVGKKYFLDEILDKEEIDRNKYEAFTQRLIDLELVNFETLDDGTISFTISGFLDNCIGLAYSTAGVNPGANECGRIIHWKKVADNWYVWYTT